VRYYHGGVPGLEVGALILPASQLGIAGNGRGAHQRCYSPGRAYVTRFEWYARLFAHCSGGDVYEVRPHAPRPDADARGSFWCPFARVVRVVERGPVGLPAEAARLAPVMGFLLSGG
jgi:hypothetical protein